MDFEQLDAEAEAARSYVELVDLAKKCGAAYERARMPIPDSLQRFFGTNGSKESVTPPVQIAPPDRPPLPVGAKSEWISIDMRKAGATNILLAILRGADDYVRAKDVTASVTEILPTVLRGTIANIGNRLDGKTIERSQSGWRLVNRDLAGILESGLFWAPVEICTVHELAAHRRDGILHILRQFESGLEIVQILEQLRNCSSWLRAPINKDLVKEDIEALKAEGKIRRRGNTKKWEIAEPKPTGGTPMEVEKMGS